MNTKEFEKKWAGIIEKELLKKFPDEFIAVHDSYLLEMPRKTLTIGSEFFGNYEIVDPEGNVHFKIDNYFKVKYILYSNRTKPAVILMPNNEAKLKSAVKEYERLLDSIIKEMERNFKQEFPEDKNFSRASNHIFSKLNLHRY